ncbi:TniB family NTP-binding protein [Pseudomonas putida]|uniref:TniB family NTP-binding protein n=1 Tax=Pseudomonas putida TaxID=303 RepID=UPI0020B245AF|nr:TniB family NTP-binding protein [Pseudomonas putida]
MASYPYLHPEALKVVEQDSETRILWLTNPRWIGYPHAAAILKKLDRLLIYPRQTRMPNMLIVGNTNNGKSDIVDRFVTRNLPQENPRGEHILCPVLKIETPPAPTEASMYSEMLRKLFERVVASSADANRIRVVKVFREIQLKVLVFDDLNNILVGKQQQCLNVLKYLGNELQISIVACGTSDLLRAVSIDEQIQNRFPPEFLPKWGMSKEFLQLLMSFERLLPLRQQSALHERTLAAKALAMCGGSLGELSLLLNSAAEYAIESGEERITMDVMNNCGYIEPDERTRLASRI